jgi:hypothetical protein
MSHSGDTCEVEELCRILPTLLDHCSVSIGRVQDGAQATPDVAVG